MPPSVATILNNRTLKNTSFSLTMTSFFRRSAIQSIPSRCIQPPSVLKLAFRLLFSVVKKTNFKRCASFRLSAEAYQLSNKMRLVWFSWQKWHWSPIRWSDRSWSYCPGLAHKYASRLGGNLSACPRYAPDWRCQWKRPRPCSVWFIRQISKCRSSKKMICCSPLRSFCPAHYLFFITLEKPWLP